MGLDTLYKSNSIVILKLMSTYAKQYENGEVEEEELDLLLDKQISILLLNSSNLVIDNVNVQPNTSYKSCFKYGVSMTFSSNERYIRFMQLIRNHCSDRIKSVGKKELGLLDYLAIAIVRLYHISRIQESKILSKVLYDFESVASKELEDNNGDTIRKPVTAGY